MKESFVYKRNIISCKKDDINDKPVVLFINTIFGRLDDVDDIFYGLNEYYNVISVDLTNVVNQETGLESILTIKEQANVIDTLLSSLHITRKINIVSLCYGSYPLLYYLKEEKAQHQVHMVFCSGLLMGFTDHIFEKIDEFHSLCSAKEYEKALTNLYDDFFSDDYRVQKRTEYYINKKLYLYKWMKKDKLEILISLIQQEYDFLAEIKQNLRTYEELFKNTNMFCLLAENDRMVDVKLQSNLLNSWGIKYKTIPNTGHAIHIEKPQEFMSELTMWLKNVE